MKLFGNISTLWFFSVFVYGISVIMPGITVAMDSGQNLPREKWIQELQGINPVLSEIHQEQLQLERIRVVDERERKERQKDERRRLKSATKLIQADKKWINRILNEILMMMESRKQDMAVIYQGGILLDELVKLNTSSPTLGNPYRQERLSALLSKSQGARKKMTARKSKFNPTRDQVVATLGRLQDREVDSSVLKLLNDYFIDSKGSIQVGGLHVSAGYMRASVGFGCGVGKVIDAFGKKYSVLDIKCSNDFMCGS